MKNILILFIAIFTVGIYSCNENGVGTSGTTDTSLNTEEDSVSYAIGVNFGTSMKSQQMDNLNTEIIAKAMRDCFNDAELTIDKEKATAVLDDYFMTLQARIMEENLVKSKEFLEANKTKEGVQVTTSGLQYIVLTEGTGAKPSATDVVKTHYHGALLDGTVFDSSVDRGEPVTFEVGRVIPGWAEALQLMPVGSKYKLFIPPFLGYGERGSPPQIGPQEMLVFEVELLEIVDLPAQ